MNPDYGNLPYTTHTTSAQSVTNSNATNLYRPYENINTTNYEEWSSFSNISYNSTLNNIANVSTNVVGGYPEQTFPWPQLVPDYQNYSHYSNVSWWTQYYHQQAYLEVHANLNSSQAENAFNESSISSYSSENGVPVSIPTSSSHYIHPPLAPPPPLTDAERPNSKYQLTQTANAHPLPQPFPIRPVPQQASAELLYQCEACFRFCSSAGGLKRHGKFCRACPANVENILSSLTGKKAVKPESHQPLVQTLAEICVGTTNQSEDIFPTKLSSSANINASRNFHPLVITLDDSSSAPSPQSDIPKDPLLCIPSHDTSFCDPLTPSTPASLPSPVADHSEPIQNSTTSNETTPSTGIDQRVPESEVLLDRTSSRKKQCPNCPLIFSSERALISHLTTHNVEKPYACPTCGSKFSRRFHLTRHVKQRGCDGKPRAQHPCGFCGKIFTRKDNLREHIKSHLGQSRARPKLPCPIPLCKREFTSRVQLQTHINLHNGERPYLCSVESCKKAFRSSSSLKKHGRIHIFDKSHTCSQCKASFATLEALTQHLATHVTATPIASYACERCPSKFSQEKDLRDHVTQCHQTEETYSCTLCRRTYRRRWRLQQHYRLAHCEKRSTQKESSIPPQTDEVLEIDASKSPSIQPLAYNCNICQQQFVSKQSLKVHYLTHPVEAPISCPECNKGFVRRECLLRHLHTKHRMPTILAIQAIQVTQNTSTNSDKASAGISLESGVQNDTISFDLPTNYCLPFQTSKADTDPSALEGNIMELLGLLVDSSALKNFGWPEKSVDYVLQAVLLKCGREPAAEENEPLAQRLRSNVKQLFTFIVDDHAALETLFARRPIEQVLEQVIQLAKSNDNSNNVVQLPL